MSFLECFVFAIIFMFAFAYIIIRLANSQREKQEQEMAELEKLVVERNKEVALKVFDLLAISPNTKYFQWHTVLSENELTCKYDVFFFDARIPYFVFFDRNNNKCEKILLSEITDINMRTIYNSTSTSRTTRDGVISRSVIGGVVAGGVGAVIGGMTADETTSTQTQNDLESLWITITTANVEFNTIRIYLDSIQEAENAIGTIKAIKAKYEE